MVMNLLKRIKTTTFWKFLILCVIKPIYGFIWNYIINFHGKILYFFWNIKKREYIDLKNSTGILIKENKSISNLANEISIYCDDKLLDFSKKKIQSKIDTGSESDNYFSKKEERFHQELFEFLPDELKKKIVDFASSDLIITTAAKYMGVFPILTRIYLYHNAPTFNKKQRSSQLWHKDGFGYKGLDFFISINNINEENGPLFFLKKKNKLGVFGKIKNIIPNPKKGERNKISDEEFNKIFSQEEIGSIIGNMGSCLIIDSYNCYHKGGYCKTKERIMLRFAFDTIDSTVVNKDSEQYQKSDSFYYYSKIKKKEINNSFLHFLFFKRSYFFKKINLPEKLIKFYHLLHYKITP